MLYQAGDQRRELEEENAEGAWRAEFMRDYGRVIHSASFRRLQGKTQVFPGHESDFFRNRLTHSLEVAQISEGIADRLNDRDEFLRRHGYRIDTRLCATAALLHDLGHPPFGHNGERALDEVMKMHGGFEGNAQSLRIVSRLEKKVVGPGEQPYGLNLTLRTLAAILKYDRPIPPERAAGSKVAKGYYGSEAPLVARLKEAVTGQVDFEGGFKTVECSLMDLADDIAYSTFDLEDALKARFLTPSDMLASSPELIERVAVKVSEELVDKGVGAISARAVLRELQEIFESIVTSTEAGQDSGTSLNDAESRMAVLATGQQASNDLADSSHLRTKLSSDLVKRAINSAVLVPNERHPMLSVVKLGEDALRRVEVLKQYVYLATVSSSRVKLQEYRGATIVKEIFRALVEERGEMMMPDDVRSRYVGHEGDRAKQMRVTCDFVAGMTDRYAAEFHARLHSDSPVSMFKQV